MSDREMNYYWVRYLLEIGETDQVRDALVANPALLHETDRHEGSLVGYLVETCDFAGLVLFLSRGASPDGAAKEVDTPLCRAVALDGGDAIRFSGVLISAGADLERHGLRGTPLHTAVSLGRCDVVDFLLKMGADINCRTIDDGTTPLWDAVLGRNIEMVELLVRRGADPGIPDTCVGKTPLDLAQEADHDRREVLLKLLS